MLEESVLADVSYTPLARLSWFSCARNPIPLPFQTPATQATNSVALTSVFTTQIFYFYWVDKIKCSYNSDSVELVKSSLKCLETKGKYCALSLAINTENSLTHQKMNANLLTRLPSFFINPKSYKIYLGSLVSCSFILLNCTSSSSLVLVLHGSLHTSATIFFFPSISKSANLCVLLILMSLDNPLISAWTCTSDIDCIKRT